MPKREIRSKSDGVSSDAQQLSTGPLRRVLRVAEETPVVVILAAMAALPVMAMLSRTIFRSAIPGAIEYLQHFTLWVGFAGAVLASREEEHLRIELPVRLPQGLPRHAAIVVRAAICATVCWFLAAASLKLVAAEAPPLPEVWAGRFPSWLAGFLEGLFEPGNLGKVGGLIPVWIAELVLPLGFLFMGIRFLLHAGRSWSVRLLALVVSLALVGMLLGPLSGFAYDLRIPGLVLMIIAGLCGVPIFIILGGIAAFFFWGDGVTLAAIPAETYGIVTNPIFPTIPLFTLAGFLLSESGADRRLVRVFRAWIGWVPGGTGIAVTVLCAFFTTFTGASGVTILALGGLLLPVLVQAGYKDGFALGLLTATGSLGLLLPPSLVVILYAVIAHVPVTDMFIGALVPGVILVFAVCLVCLAQGTFAHIERPSWNFRDARAAAWNAKWELLIPVIALVAIFGGFCTLVEAAAILVLYIAVIELAVYRDLPVRNLWGVLVRCGTLIGGVLIILGVAMGLTSYIVDAEVPSAAADWAKDHIQAKWVFLICMNLGLILVGCLMDIFSALIVVVPILLPMAEVFGVDPIHLGVIFLANLELGYLTPPIGMNLFLASFRFKRPLPAVYLAALPFLGILLIVVLIITFVPAFSLGVVDLLR